MTRRPLHGDAAAARERGLERPGRGALLWALLCAVLCCGEALGLGCVAWRQTAGCNPAGELLAQFDLACEAAVGRMLAGYCECAEGVRTAQSTCDHATFSCAARCAGVAAVVVDGASGGGPDVGSRGGDNETGGLDQVLVLGVDVRAARAQRAQDLLAMQALGVRYSFAMAPDPVEDVLFAQQENVRRAFLHAWDGYVRHAWGADTLRPVSRTRGTEMNMGVTIVDALDTMIIMSLPGPYVAAAEWTKTLLKFDFQEDINLFEVTIRVVGGLLAAYDLSGDAGFLQLAQDLADRMMFAFDSMTGMPFGTLGLKSLKRYNPTFLMGSSSMAELGTVQLELHYLTRHTGLEKYSNAADRIMKYLDGLDVPNGLYPMLINPDTGEVTDSTITLGARCDSLYEYFLKQWVYAGDETRDERRWILKLYEESVEGIATLLHNSSPGNLLYLSERVGKAQLVIHKMDHLVCFVPGMLALGTKHGVGGAGALHVAEQLMHTCCEMYRRHPTGLAPEIVTFVEGKDFVANSDAAHSRLRPEAVESLFVMYRVTQDVKYRAASWEIFSSIEKHARVDTGGYSGLSDVTRLNSSRIDSMESWFLAETLKYLYLVFSDDDALSLGDYVFNTEGHPLSIGNRRTGARSSSPEDSGAAGAAQEVSL